mmetsp:Transcript_31934/g.89853  ORF Transcript_31934/g.89853 Transcript_31934/m.89853 type:complete len:210 (-) Transcript_31934:674-1303(-)
MITEEGVDADTMRVVMRHGIADSVSQATVWRHALRRCRASVQSVVWKLRLVEVGRAVVALPERHLRQGVLHEQAVHRHMRRARAHVQTGRAGVLVAVHQELVIQPVVGAPQPKIITDDAGRVDLDHVPAPRLRRAQRAAVAGPHGRPRVVDAADCGARRFLAADPREDIMDKGPNPQVVRVDLAGQSAGPPLQQGNRSFRSQVIGRQPA